MEIMAKNKSFDKKKIENVSDEMNEIASQNKDFAPARRRIRSAFTQVQKQLDHVLFKVRFLFYFFLFVIIKLFTDESNF